MTKYDMLNTSLEEDMKYLEANEDVDPRILNLIAAKLIKENNIIYMYSYLKHAVNASDSILKYMVIRLINYDEYSNEGYYGRKSQSDYFYQTKKTSPLVGVRVYHPSFGYGKIINVDGDKCEVFFDKVGKKKIMGSYLEKC